MQKHRASAAHDRAVAPKFEVLLVAGLASIAAGLIWSMTATEASSSVPPLALLMLGVASCLPFLVANDPGRARP